VLRPREQQAELPLLSLRGSEIEIFPNNTQAKLCYSSLILL
jgi:hypothetical protein